MTLDVKLTLDKKDLRFQENAVCGLTLTNLGSEPLTTVDPTWNPALLRLKTINVKTGAETVYAPPARHGGLPLTETPLAPRETLSAEHGLLSLPKVLLPGDYEISAIMLYNQGKGQAESPPVRVSVRPTTPRSLFSREGVGAWVNVAAASPEVVLMAFRACAGGGPEDLRFVAPAGLRAAPVLSVGPFNDPVAHHWVAWIDEGQLKFIHQHRTQGPSPLRSFPLSSAKDVVIPPLHSDSTPDDDSRPGGALLLYRESGELEALKLGLDKATSLARSPLPGPRPLWMSTFERAGNKRTVLFVRASSDKVSLHEASWPGSGGPPPRVLGEWPGAFKGADALVDGGDVLLGTLLLHSLEGARLTWNRLDFKLDAKGAFSAAPAGTILSDGADPFESALVRRSESAVAALLRSKNGLWSVYDGGKTASVPYDLRETPYPLDLDFLNDREPVLIAGFKEAGFHMRMADGRPLPPSRK